MRKAYRHHPVRTSRGPAWHVAHHSCVYTARHDMPAVTSPANKINTHLLWVCVFIFYFLLYAYWFLNSEPMSVFLFYTFFFCDLLVFSDIVTVNGKVLTVISLPRNFCKTNAFHSIPWRPLTVRVNVCLSCSFCFGLQPRVYREQTPEFYRTIPFLSVALIFTIPFILSKIVCHRDHPCSFFHVVRPTNAFAVFDFYVF